MFRLSLPEPRRGNGFFEDGFRAAILKIAAIRNETAILQNEE